MLYFSHLKGRRVSNEDGKMLGKLEDLIFVALDTPLVTKIVVKKGDVITVIPTGALKTFNKNIIVDANFSTEEVYDNELSVLKNLLDKQIIDVTGRKVVRVNDVTIQEKELENPTYYLSGVDIGIRGILRWIGLERAALPLYRLFRLENHPHFLTWSDIQPLELSSGSVQLKKGMSNLERMHPEDLADYLERTTIKNVNKILNNLDEQYAAEVIGDLNPSYQSALFRRFSSEKSAKLMERIDSDEAVDILLTLTKAKRDEILSAIVPKRRKKLESLLKLSKTPIGSLIQTNFITVSSKDTIGSAASAIKEDPESAYAVPYIYVLNEEEELVGVVKLQSILLEPSDARIFNVMEQELIVIHVSTPKDIAIKKMLKYHVYALPVINEQKHIEGIVTFDDIAQTVLKKYD